MQPFQEAIVKKLKEEYHTELGKATTKQLYNAVSKAALETCWDTWQKPVTGKTACYLSAEFLVGRLIHSNLLNLGLLGETENLLKDAGINPNVFEDVEDDALGNGGLGRLAACFLDSAATQGVPLMGMAFVTVMGCLSSTLLTAASRKKRTTGFPGATRGASDAMTKKSALTSVTRAFGQFRMICQLSATAARW